MGVSAPAETQARLLELAACDLALQRVEVSLRTLPETLHIPTLEAAVDEIKGRKHEAMIEKENIQAELSRAESDVQLVESRILTDEERLVHTASAKDAQGLGHELESLRKRRSSESGLATHCSEKGGNNNQKGETQCVAMSTTL